MQPKELATALMIGGALIALGFVPGVLQRVQDGIQNFRDSLLSPFPARFPQQTDYENLPRPFWLAGLGLAVILLCLVAYIVS
jgi:hypothetical protein